MERIQDALVVAGIYGRRPQAVRLPAAQIVQLIGDTNGAPTMLGLPVEATEATPHLLCDDGTAYPFPISRSVC